MHIRNPNSLSPDAKKFLESLSLKFDADGLILERPGFRYPLFIVNVSDRAVSLLQHARLLGITSWPYVDDNGATVKPAPDRMARPSLNLQELFKATFGREMTEDEVRAIDVEVLDAVANTPGAKAFAAKVDFPAMHAFDCAGRFEDREKAISDISGPSPNAQAVRRFILEHPVLAAPAWASSALFDAAEKAKTADEAYVMVREAVMNRGFQSVELKDREFVGGVPGSVLDAIRGLRFDVGNGDLDETNVDMAYALNLARRLPAEYFPRDEKGYRNLAAAGHFIACLEEDYDGPENAYEEGFGFDMKFRDAELAKLFATAGDSRFTALPHGIVSRDEASYEKLGIYGVALAGHEDWAKGDRSELPAGFRDYSALKQALLSDGVGETMRKAEEFYDRVQSLEAAPTP